MHLRVVASGGPRSLTKGQVEENTLTEASPATAFRVLCNANSDALSWMLFTDAWRETSSKSLDFENNTWTAMGRGGIASR